jgi:hypothetical protein
LLVFKAFKDGRGFKVHKDRKVFRVQLVLQVLKGRKA